MIPAFCFYLISTLLIISSVLVVLKNNLFTCALYLAAALSMVAALFVLLGADFLAALQIMLYVGGVLVLVIFAVMLSSAEPSKIPDQINSQWAPSLVVALTLLSVILVAFNRTTFALGSGEYAPTTLAIGRLLLNDLKLPFEAVSLILIVALAGAVIFSRRRDQP